MLIVCPNCTTSYEVKGASLGPAGRSVRCKRCTHIWFAANTAALTAIARAHRADLTAVFGATAGATAGVTAGAAAGGIGQPNDIPDAPDPGVAVGAAADNNFPAEPAAQPEPVPEQPVLADAAASPAFGPDTPGAEPVVAITDAPPLAPAEPDAGALPADPVGEDIETVAARLAAAEASRYRFRWPLSRWPTAVVLLLLLNAALIGLRLQVVQRLPQTASLYAAVGMPVNLRGLIFANVTTEKEANDGVQVLMIEGVIVNTTTRAAPVPRLRFAARNEHGHEIYTWTARPPRDELAPGATLAFRSRLASPPPEAHDVLVRFFNRRDLIDSSE
jgi:predicted Zn finger-like uncharacterized protein